MAARVALVHDFLLDLRGAERVFAAICDAWPDADVFTAVYDEKGTEGRFADRAPAHVVPAAPAAHLAHVPAAAAAVPARDRVAGPARLRHRDLVLERVGARRARRSRRGARLLLPQPVPLRVVGARGDAAARARRSCARRCGVLLNRWRQWDYIAAQRVDAYVANSRLTAARVRRYLGRESTVLHPPVELERFSPGPVGDHYMVLAELMAHKRIDVAVHAFNRLAPAADRGRRRARSCAACAASRARRSRFTGRVPDPQVAELLSSARALVVTAAEEFGIAAVEALASGRPVIALGAGGVHGERARGGDRRLLRARRPGRARARRSRRSTRWPSTRRPAWRRAALRHRALPGAAARRSWPAPWRPSGPRGRAIALPS